LRLLLGKPYRPIDGEVVGELTHIDIILNEVYWEHKKYTFVIPYERFNEYFCEASVSPS